ncbi:TPA: hypothetical protein ACH3X1_006469 [Trebouxia sp. C0004]
MFKAPYKSAELAVMADGSLAKRPEVMWEPVRNNWERNRKSYYEHKLAGHFEGLRGQWAVCNSGVAEVYVTSGAARANKQDNQAFVVMIDGEELATLVENSVLLHDYEIPQANELPRIHRP